MKNRIKVITYNIHAGIDTNGSFNLDRIAHIISEENADIVGLNEVDQCTSRSKGVDQAKYIADKLDYHYVFGKAINYSGGEYGNAFISKYPIVASKNYRLPIHSLKTREPRAMLECDVNMDGKLIKVFTTHLGLEKAERELSIEYISNVLQTIDTSVVLLGDFNLVHAKDFEELLPLMNILKDTAEDIGKGSDIMTFDSENPSTKIDYILASKDAKVLSTYTRSSLASDHLPLICELEV